MQLTIDIGNSSLKAGLFQERIQAEENKAKRTRSFIEEPVSTLRCDVDNEEMFMQFVSSWEISSCIISSTASIPDWLETRLSQIVINDSVVMNGSTPLPVRNGYSTPQTLGTDRISSVIGAYFSTGCHAAVLCIDSGTALTFDVIDDHGTYIGGNISPGVEMRLRALHEFTARLPLVSRTGNVSQIGTDTETAIRNGVIHGVKKEIDGYIREYRRKFPGLYVFFTGGDAVDFANNAKKRIFADKYLVLKGLNIILNHIHQNK